MLYVFVVFKVRQYTFTNAPSKIYPTGALIKFCTRLVHWYIVYCTNALVCRCWIREPSAYFSIRKHKSAYVSILQHYQCTSRSVLDPRDDGRLPEGKRTRRTSAYVSIRQHTSAYVTCLKGSGLVGARQWCPSAAHRSQVQRRASASVAVLLRYRTARALRLHSISSVR